MEKRAVQRRCAIRLLTHVRNAAQTCPQAHLVAHAIQAIL